MEKQLYVTIAKKLRRETGYHMLIEQDFGDMVPDIIAVDDVGRIRMVVEVKTRRSVDLEQIEKYKSLGKVVLVAPSGVELDDGDVVVVPLESFKITR